MNKWNELKNLCLNKIKGKSINEWNELERLCLKNNLTEEQVIVYLKRCLKFGVKKPDGSKKQWLLDRFDLYVKERIKQKQENLHYIHGSKKEAVRKVVASKKYQDLHEMYCVETKNSGFKILAQLISEPRQNKKLLRAFNDNGEMDII
jgi:hypothetical protein